MKKDIYAITHKLAEKQDGKHTAQVFESSIFEKVLLLDEQSFFLKQELQYEAQVLACTAICSHQDPKKALVIGGRNPQIAQELLKHYDPIHVSLYGGESWLSQTLQQDLLKLDFTPYAQQHRFESSCFAKDSFKALKDVDIVIAYSPLTQEEFSMIKETLNPQAVFMSTIPSLTTSIDQAKQNLTMIGEHFKILMPFFIPYMNENAPYFVFASNAIHPLADLQLQRADMLEDAPYYSALLHQSMFTLPKWLFSSLRGIIKN